MIQGRGILSTLSLLAVAMTVGVLLSACSGKKTRAPDCFDCPEQQQEWGTFSWNQLEGSWRGSVETVTNIVTAAKKDHKEDVAQLSFLDGQKFLKAKGITECATFPKHSVVLMGQLWQERDQMTGLNVATGKIELPIDAGRRLASVGGAPAKIYEVFGSNDSEAVFYGRAAIAEVNGRNTCNFSRIGGNFVQNRLALPAINFSERVTRDGRVLASGTTPEYEISLEFLDFRPNAVPQGFVDNARKPASTEVQDQPQLFLRVFKIARNVPNAFGRGEWTGTQEYLYRLWRVK